MDNLIVKPVDVLGSSIMAAQDEKGRIFAGVNYFCNALGMTKGQRDKQVQKVQKDAVLKQGCFRLEAGVFDPSNEAITLRIDFIPLWLAKITITEKTRQERPEFSRKLLEYQLKAKDILAAAFMPKQISVPQTVPEQIKLLAQGNVQLNQRIDALDKKLETALLELPLLGVESEKVDKALKHRGVEVAGGKESNAYKDKRLLKRLYWDMHSQLRREFGVSTYKGIKRNQTDLALKFLEGYKPPLFLQEQIDMANAQQRIDM